MVRLLPQAILSKRVTIADLFLFSLPPLFVYIQVDDKNFDVLLEYLDGLKGKSRELTVTGAEKILEEDENDEECSESGKTVFSDNFYA